MPATKPVAPAPRTRPTAMGFFGLLNWINGSPLVDYIEPYRQRIFEETLDRFDMRGRIQRNLVLCGRAKKNYKSADGVLASLFALLAWDSPGGNQCYLLA